MAGKVKRITLTGIKPIKEKNAGAPCAPSRSDRAQMDKKEREWRAEHDARTLAEAASIYADPARARMARGAATRIVRDEEARLSNLRAITRKGSK